MDFLKKNTIWIICILSFFSAYAYNQINLKHTPEELVRLGHTIKTNDDASYISPPTNWIGKGKWKDNSIGMQGYFNRSPGYGLFYLALLNITEYPTTLLLLKLAQLLLFACSVYWLYKICNYLFKKRSWSLIIATMYGLTPFAIGFLFYTLTEGITPALLLFYIFLLFKADSLLTNQQKITYYLMAASVFAFLFLVRPPLGLFGLLLPVFIFKDYWKKGVSNFSIMVIIVGAIAFSLTAIWQYRNYKLTGDIVGLHSIYYSEGNSIYRPTFKTYWKFSGAWAEEGYVTHSYMVPLWKNAIKGDTSYHYVENALNTLPDHVMNHFGKKRLSKLFKNYQASVLYQKTFYDKKLSMPKENLILEQEVIEELNQLTTEYKNEFWLQYYLISPLKVFKTMAFHSNLSLYVFQHTYRGNWLMETVRFIFFGLHSLCFLALLLNFFLIKKMNWKLTTLLLITLAYVLYLCFIQRGIEERYTLPILPLLMIGLASLFNQLKGVLGRQS